MVEAEKKREESNVTIRLTLNNGRYIYKEIEFILIINIKLSIVESQFIIKNIFLESLLRNNFVYSKVKE